MKKNNINCLNGFSSLNSLLILIFPLFIVTSCNVFYSKEKYLTDFEKFIDQTEIKFINFTPEKWDLANAEYDRFTIVLYQRVYVDLTENDQRTIGKLKFRYETSNLKAILIKSFSQ